MKSSNVTHDFQYSFISKSFHWLLAVLIICMLSLGFYMVSISEDPSSHWYFNLHKSMGLIVGLIIFLAVLWRLFHKPGPLPTTIPPWQTKVAKLVHWLLYVFMILMPLTGILGASLGKNGLPFFGIPIHLGLPKNKTLSGFLFDAHVLFSKILLALVIIHVLAAFVHLVVNKDKVFKRMLF